MNLFEKATRDKLRFPTSAGLISVEDLWDLPLTSERKANLNATAIAINTELKGLSEESFVETSTNPRRAALELQLDIVKHIIGVKQAENTARADAAKNAAMRERLLQELSNRQDQKFKDMSEDELRTQLASLGS